jgi:Mg2+ and Co2+ transporter CorA
VLLIDYVAREHTEEGRRKIVAQEFSDIDSLRRFYMNDKLSQQAALRVIHVQNASWATRFLLRKFNIDASDDLVGTTFGRWAKYEKPKRRGQGDKAKPWLSGKTFRAQKDPWRGISRAAFGMDYLRHYEKRKIVETPANAGLKMMELNHFDALDNPAYGWDVYAQRLSVYVQLKDGEPGMPVDPNIRNPYNEEEYQEYQRLKRQYGSIDANGHEQYIPKLQTLDNGSTIIIFEHSQSGSVSDTLIGARQEIEQRWRRLTFYLPREETSTDDRLAIECMDFILRDIFKALSFTWEKYINICETHVSILEDKIYENPADESRAPELWTNSNLWLKVERILYVHTDIVREMRSHLKEVANENPQEDQNDPWLSGSADEFRKLTTQFQEGVVKPTTNLSDLMYKSVGIRDARHSLQLGLSMWRLSWITFIFLPLTFVSGFFGMNVDTFEGNPSIKWWFIATVPLFAVVLIVWYGVKHALAKQHQNPLRRGVYETLFHELAEDHPNLWTRRGPREGIVPVGWWSAMKWQLINRWFHPERTIATKDYDPGVEELGFMSRIRKYLVQRWLENIVVLPATAAATTSPDLIDSLPLTNDPKHFSAVEELVQVSAPVALAEADPTAASRLRHRLPLDRLRSLSPTRSEGGRPKSGGSGKSDGGESAVMVEEKGEDDRSGDERSGDEDDDEEETRPKSIQQRLNVPL